MNVRAKLLIGVLVSLLLIGAGASASEEHLARMELIASNEYLEMYFEEAVHRIAVRDPQSGNVWYSSPVDHEVHEAIAMGSGKDEIQSNLGITYYTPPPVLGRRTRDSYNHSIGYDAFEITYQDDGVRIEYTFGKRWDTAAYIPRIMSEERFSDFLSHIDEGDRDRVLSSYIPMMLVPHDGSPRLTVGTVEKEETFGDYMLVPLTDDYAEHAAELAELRKELAALEAEGADESALQNVQRGITMAERRVNSMRTSAIRQLLDTIRDNREDRDVATDHTFSDVEALVDQPTYVKDSLSFMNRRRLTNAIIESGFTPLDIVDAHEEYGIEPPQENIEIFVVPIEFRLDGNSMVVNVPCDEVVFPFDPDDVMRTYPLRTVSILPWFEAANPEDEGYMFVPDGSGALIELNNERLHGRPYIAPIYGFDYSVTDITTPTSREQAYMPVYGMKRNDQAFLAVIEEGESFATLTAEISGRATSYNYLRPEFRVTSSARVTLEGVRAGQISIYQREQYEGDLQIRYYFLSDDQADYSGMANAYREHLLQRAGAELLNPPGDVPFFLELSGAIPVIRPILGVRRTVMEPLTTYTQAQEIIETLTERGIGDVHLRYEGWLDGGIEHKYPSRLRLESAVGSQRELTGFSQFLSDRGMQLYPHVSLTMMYSRHGTTGFSSRGDASMMLSRVVTKVHDFHMHSLELDPDRFRYILSPNRLPALVDRFMNRYQAFGVDGLSLAYMGNHVSSDFRERGMTTRQDVISVYKEQVERMVSEMDLKLMIEGGQGWALPYANAVVRLPATSSKLNVQNRCIPFAQMALSGVTHYASQPLNDEADLELAALRVIETGSSPFFKWFYAPSTVVNNTDFDHLVALHYGEWLDDAEHLYHWINEALSEVYGERIVRHEQITADVFRTTYANGRAVVVNYGEQAVEVSGTRVDGRGFALMDAEN